MPTIPQFSIQLGREAAAAGRLQPSEIGIEAEEQGARNVSRLTQERRALIMQSGEDWDRAIKQIGAGLENVGATVERHQAATEISSIGPAFGALQSNLQGQYNDALKAHAAGDPEALTKFNDALDEKLQQFRDAANTPAGREHADTLANALQLRYQRGQIEDVGRIAGDQAVASFQTTVNKLTENTLADPRSLGLSLYSLRQQTQALADQHDVPADIAAKLSNQYFNAAAEHLVGTTIANVARGTDDLPSNPDAAREMARQYGQYLTPAMEAQLAKHADLMTQINAVADQAATSAQAQQFRAQSASRTTDYATSILGSVSHGQPIPTTALADAIHDPGLTDDDKGAIAAAAKAVAGGGLPPTTNPAVMDGLLSRLSSGDRPSPAEVMSQVTAGRLSYNDAVWAMDQAKQPPSPGLQQLTNQLQTARNTLATDPGSGAINPAGLAAYQRFQSWAVNQYRTGETIDPKQLPTILESFEPTGQDALSHVPPLPDRPPLAAILGGG